MTRTQCRRAPRSHPRPRAGRGWSAAWLALPFLWAIVLLGATPPLSASPVPGDGDRIGVPSAVVPHTVHRAGGALEITAERVQRRTIGARDGDGPLPAVPVRTASPGAAASALTRAALRRVGVFVPLCQRLPYHATAPPLPV